MTKCFGLIIFGCLAFVHSAGAARLSHSGSDNRTTFIELTGQIVAGDAESLKGFIDAANSRGSALAGVRLNSIGGDLGEALRLAELVRNEKLLTAVAQGDTCASACFIVFAAGMGKIVEYGARIGVHGASDRSGKETIRSSAATVLLARVVRELGVPTEIIGKMVVTPPEEMVWLTPDELRSMDVMMIGKPALPSPGQAARSLLPNASSNRAAPPLAWQELLESAAAVSAGQNNGRPFSIRHCDPRTRNCWHAVVVKGGAEAGDMVVKSLIDMAGKTLRREFCQFNVHGNIRACLDWDSNEINREVKDRDVKWKKVADELLPGGWWRQALVARHRAHVAAGFPPLLKRYSGRSIGRSAVPS